MRADIRSLRFVLLVAVITAVSACATRSTIDSPRAATRPTAAAPPERTARQSPRDTRRESARDSTARASEPVVADASADTESLEGIAAVLAERRRSDYPALELAEAGFTITEQVHIGNDARSEYEQALALLRQERFAEGIELLRGVIETSPAVTAPYIDLGIALGRIGELEAAAEALENAALLSPENPVIHNELGIVYRRMGRFADARASYERALAVYDGFHFARRNLAVLCDLYLADPVCALQNYRAYLDSVGMDPSVEIWIADLQNRVGN